MFRLRQGAIFLRLSALYASLDNPKDPTAPAMNRNKVSDSVASPESSPKDSGSVADPKDPTDPTDPTNPTDPIFI